MMGGRVDLNCDVGESFGAWSMGADADVIPSVTSVNIACGYHAGDPGVMRRTVRFAQAAAASIGAHPGLPDLAGFGRRDMAVSARELEDMILYQIGALAAIARAEGAVVAHVKAHGALYNMAARDRAVAGAIAKAVASFDRALVFYALAGSPMLDVGREAGLTVAAEGFADRAYEADGSLTPRSRPGSIINDPSLVVARAIRMVRDGTVVATNGQEIAVQVDTLCVHGDTPGADALARELRRGLQTAGIAVRAIG